MSATGSKSVSMLCLIPLPATTFLGAISRPLDPPPTTRMLPPLRGEATRCGCD